MEYSCQYTLIWFLVVPCCTLIKGIVRYKDVRGSVTPDQQLAIPCAKNI